MGHMFGLQTHLGHNVTGVVDPEHLALGSSAIHVHHECSKVPVTRQGPSKAVHSANPAEQRFDALHLDMHLRFWEPCLSFGAEAGKHV